MNLASLLFLFLAYGLAVAMYNVGESDDAPEFPTFTAPDVEFENLPSSCGGFTDCVEFVGKILVNFVLGVVYVVLLIVEIIRLLVVLLVIIATNAFTGIDGVPEWFNALMVGTIGITTIVIIYKSVRKGDTDSA